jgi:sulfite exporter TauE/SafE
MDSFVLVALNGLALGLASTLHCAGMCGAISCSLLLAQERGGARSAQAAFALTHLGRITAYATAGAVVGTAGAPAIAWLDREAAFMLLQWAGAASLIWIGLSTAGVLPSLTVLDRSFAAISGRVARAGVASPRREIVPLISGMAWGMMPCAMVYAALFTAMLTGSAGAGATSMIAFGIGTLPGLFAASFGFRRLAGVAKGGTGRVTAGLAIALFGIATVFIAHPKAAYLCLPGSGARSSQAVTPATPATVWPSARRLDRHQAVQRAAVLRSAIIPAAAPASLRDRP